MNRLTATALAVPAVAALLACAAQAQTGYTITGSMSNFDCTNHCDYDCDEMEIELEGAQPSEIIHTYTNGNYGAPTVTLSPDGSSTIIDYRNPQHRTAVNAIEHFGVTVRTAYYYGPPVVYHPVHVRWYRDGHIATVNGQVPNPAGGTSPATQPLLPTITTGVTPGSTGHGGVTLTVTNNDPVQKIWVKRRAQVSSSPVSLEDLMSNNPVVTTSIPIDTTPVPLNPLQSLTLAHDLIEFEEEQSVVFSAEYFQNLQNADPFNPDSPGVMLGNVMTNQVASPQDLSCPHGPPTVVTQPGDTTQDQGTRVDLRVQAHGDDVTPLVYQWMKDGVDLADGGGISGVTSNHLRIDHLQPVNEGFYSVRMTNFCATRYSSSALVFITGHNRPPVHTGAVCDPVDFNHDDLFPDTADLDDFLRVFSGGACSNAPACGDIDFNNDGLFPDTGDIDAFLTVFSGGACQ
ncbi:MAG: immunoglobulin domain-containing protein [Phycisphaerales bacterium]